MPIKVQCACGKAFAAKDELAGKTVKCPGCQKPLKIPGGAPAVAKAPAKAAPPKPAAAAAATPKAPAAKAPPAPAAAPPSPYSLFDEIGLQAAAANTRPCPGCTEPMPIDAVVCIKCGYNSNLGRRMQTVKVGSAGASEGGHGVIVEELMNRAAVTMEEDAQEEVKKTKSGMPWWVFLILLIALVSFAAWMLLVWGKEKEKEGEGGGGKGKGSFYRRAEPALLVVSEARGREPIAKEADPLC